ncbi:uncharacterized protein LOC120797120 [Xiphias gladius]|uniref:uncharacterized protein LOC120797120 n=1 Tax=Xiphias gladius TaxID=8245 RepID=UPI001A993317|nr:uncharacterized protein LOC120797120 [Xiphias gladius]
MMRSWRRLCFIFLAISSTSRGLDTSDSPQDKEKEGSLAPFTESPSLKLLNETEKEASHPTLATPSSQTHTTESETNLLSGDVTTLEDKRETDEGYDDDSFNTTVESGESTEAPTTTLSSVPGSAREDGEVATVSMATASTSSKPVTSEDAGSMSLGYLILVLIILAIIVLCVILYFLRRVSRSYSFDLQRQDPMIQQFSEPTGTFETVYLDDLDRPAPKDQAATNDLSPPPVANGTGLQGSHGENAPQEQPDANGLETLPTGNTGPSLGNDPADSTCNTSSSTNLFFDATAEVPQNENNNNPSVFSSGPFVEINLDEPAWCDQLLTSPEATSSVLPFSPLSFPSASSS